ncbi:hypothetical protein RWA06_31070 (plasmid) [Sinorhizobium meliloti]|uniref:hypothetical protein n=1 Tax=Rhizobium meliloti TaxID=382 RepID=UPI00299E5B67|nr:hypothetical protein [Sinorhizobium meliloti]
MMVYFLHRECLRAFAQEARARAFAVTPHAPRNLGFGTTAWDDPRQHFARSMPRPTGAIRVLSIIDGKTTPGKVSPDAASCMGEQERAEFLFRRFKDFEPLAIDSGHSVGSRRPRGAATS